MLSAFAFIAIQTLPQQQTGSNGIEAAAATLFGISGSESLNWAGYAVTGANVTNVTGSFNVPSLSAVAGASSGGVHVPNSPVGKTIAAQNGPVNKPGNGNGGHAGGSSSTSYAAFWAGIDGYNSNTVEQAGVLMEVQNSVVSYSVWYEFYPAAPVYASWTPSPGDHVTVYVNYTASNGTFVATVVDSTLGKSYVSPYTAVSGAQRSSAEWIAEAPSSARSILPLADFGTVYFGLDSTGAQNTNYATVSGEYGSIGTLSGSFSVYSINMVKRNGSLEAQTSPLSTDGTSFYVTWKNS